MHIPQASYIRSLSPSVDNGVTAWIQRVLSLLLTANTQVFGSVTKLLVFKC